MATALFAASSFKFSVAFHAAVAVALPVNLYFSLYVKFKCFYLPVFPALPKEQGCARALTRRFVVHRVLRKTIARARARARTDDVCSGE